MDKGLWVWPPDFKGQRKVVRMVSQSDHLMAALNSLAKSKDGLSNAQIDDSIGDASNWMTLWVTRQLMALGFADYKADFFGNPGKYTLTDLGRAVLQAITGAPTPATSPVSRPTPPASGNTIPAQPKPV